MQVLSASLTDLGLRRPLNEDSLVVRPGLGFFAVCDGMGGHAAGEVASRVAAEALEDFIQHTDGVTADFTWPFEYRPDRGVDGNRLVCAFLLANRDIRQRVIDEPDLRGMATTAVCLLLGAGGWGLGTGSGGWGAGGLGGRLAAARPGKGRPARLRPQPGEWPAAPTRSRRR